MIEEYCQRKEVLHYLDENNQVQDIDVCEVKDRIIAETADKFIKFILKRYGNLLDMKMVVVAGGTGEVFYPYIKEYLERERPYLKGKIILSKSILDGKEYGAIYAVAIGMYKDMMMQLAND